MCRRWVPLLLVAVGCTDAKPAGTVLVHGVHPNEIVSGGDTLYWTTNEGLSALPLGDATAEPRPLVTGRTRALGVALDQASIYIADEGQSGMYTGAVLSIRRDGTGVSTVLDRLLNPSSIAVDANNVYWTSGNCVCQKSLDGSTFGLDVFVDAGAMAVDASFIYYFDRDHLTISRVPIGGTTPTVLAQSSANAIAVNEDSLFWSTQDLPGTIEKLDLSSGTTTTIFTGDPNALLGPVLLIDGDELYWYSDAIERAKLDGRQHEVLTDSQVGAQGLAVDQTNIYWGNWDDENLSGTLKMLPK